jgi:hypothetical protein
MEDENRPRSGNAENKAVKALAFGTIGLILFSLVLLIIMGIRAGVF